MEFLRASRPEDVGVSSKVVNEFLKKLDGIGVENHSIVIIKDDKIALENYTAPYAAKYPHAVFSCSKGFISTAVGFLIDEGKLTLDTPILTFYPEYEKQASKDERNAKVTVRELLTMTCGKKCKFIKDMTKGDYADDWIGYKFRDDRAFMYSNDDVYMLSKAITRITGGSVIDYLMPRLFEPLGIERPFWELTNQGIEAGATGLYIRSFDMAKVAYCYLNGGKYDGKQVIPREWAEIAGKYYVELPSYYSSSKDYGFYFWGDPYGGYRFDGMYGQFGVVFPNHNAVLVLTNTSTNTPVLIDLMFEYFPKAFEEAPVEAEIAPLKERLIKNETLTLPTGGRSTLEEFIMTRTYRMAKYRIIDVSGYMLSVIPVQVSGTFPKKAKRSFDRFSFDFYDEGVKMSWNEGAERNTVDIGLDGTLHEADAVLGGVKYKMLSSGVWRDDTTLDVTVWTIETPARRIIRFKFKRGGRRMRMKIDAFPTFRDFTMGNINEVVDFSKHKLLSKIVCGLLNVFFKFTTPNLGARSVRKTDAKEKKA